MRRRRLATRSAGVVVVAVALTACNAILGIGDPVVVRPDAGSDTGPSGTLPTDGGENASDGESIMTSDGAGRAEDAGPDAQPDASVDAVAPRATELANGQRAAKAIAVDGTNVYWVVSTAGTTNQGEIHRCPLGGCNGPPELFAGGLNNPSSIALADNDVFWSENTASANILKKNKTAGQGAQYRSGLGPPVDLTVSGNFVYWAEQNDGTNRCDIGGCSGAPFGLVTGNGSAAPRGIAVGDGRAFWAADNEGGAIVGCLISSCTYAEVATNEGHAVSIAVANPLGGATLDLFWTVTVGDGGTGHVASGNGYVMNGAPGTPVATGGKPFKIAADETDVYWTDQADGTVKRFERATRATTTFASQIMQPWGIALTGTTVYVTDALGDRVLRIPRK